MKATADKTTNTAATEASIIIVSVENRLVCVGVGVGVGVCDGDGLAVGDGVEVGDFVGSVVGVGLDVGVGEGAEDSFVVVIVYKPESAQTFKELLAYSRKPTTTPSLLFKVNVALPQHGVEEKAVQEALTHCPVLFVLKMKPPPVKLWSSFHKAKQMLQRYLQYVDERDEV